MKILAIYDRCPDCGCTRIVSSTYTDDCADCGRTLYNYFNNKSE